MSSYHRSRDDYYGNKYDGHDYQRQGYYAGHPESHAGPSREPRRPANDLSSRISAASPGSSERNAAEPRRPANDLYSRISAASPGSSERNAAEPHRTNTIRERTRPHSGHGKSLTHDDGSRRSNQGLDRSREQSREQHSLDQGRYQQRLDYGPPSEDGETSAGSAARRNSTADPSQQLLARRSPSASRHRPDPARPIAGLPARPALLSSNNASPDQSRAPPPPLRSRTTTNSSDNHELQSVARTRASITIAGTADRTMTNSLQALDSLANRPAEAPPEYPDTQRLTLQVTEAIVRLGPLSNDVREAQKTLDESLQWVQEHPEHKAIFEGTAMPELQKTLAAATAAEAIVKAEVSDRLRDLVNALVTHTTGSSLAAFSSSLKASAKQTFDVFRDQQEEDRQGLQSIAKVLADGGRNPRSQALITAPEAAATAVGPPVHDTSAARDGPETTSATATSEDLTATAPVDPAAAAPRQGSSASRLSARFASIEERLEDLDERASTVGEAQSAFEAEINEAMNGMIHEALEQIAAARRERKRARVESDAQQEPSPLASSSQPAQRAHTLDPVPTDAPAVAIPPSGEPEAPRAASCGPLQQQSESQQQQQQQPHAETAPSTSLSVDEVKKMMTDLRQEVDAESKARLDTVDAQLARSFQLVEEQFTMVAETRDRDHAENQALQSALGQLQRSSALHDQMYTHLLREIESLKQDRARDRALIESLSRQVFPQRAVMPLVNPSQVRALYYSRATEAQREDFRLQFLQAAAAAQQMDQQSARAKWLHHFQEWQADRLGVRADGSFVLTNPTAPELHQHASQSPQQQQQQQHRQQHQQANGTINGNVHAMQGSPAATRSAAQISLPEAHPPVASPSTATTVTEDGPINGGHTAAAAV